MSYIKLRVQSVSDACCSMIKCNDVTMTLVSVAKFISVAMCCWRL